MELPLLDATEQASFTALSLSLSLSLYSFATLLTLGQLLYGLFCAGLCSLVYAVWLYHQILPLLSLDLRSSSSF